VGAAQGARDAGGAWDAGGASGRSSRGGATVGIDPDSAQGAVFERLRALRKRLASEQGLPPYVIFHDSTLREMAIRRPLTLDEFAALPGVGQAKLSRYGEHFIAALRESRP
jgi:ATP-dependent DNA helicase RecQ